MDELERMGAPKQRRTGAWLVTIAVFLFVAAGAVVAFRPPRAAGGEPAPESGRVAPRVAPKDDSRERLAAARAIAQALGPSEARRLPERTADEQELAALADAVQARGASVENPCVQWTGPFCTRTVLEPFFSALDGLRAGTPSPAPVTIAAFGNSLIAGDRIVDVVREQFARRFGDGGRGLLLIDRLADYGPRTRTGFTDGGWGVHTVGELKDSPWPFGLSGVVHVSTRPNARSRFNLSGETRGTLFWVDRDAGPIELRVDGKPLLQTTPRGENRHQQADFTLPPEAKTLELIAHERGTAIQGLALDKPGPGIVLDTLGVPSADASLFLRADEAMVSAQLRARSPGLVLVMLGGNEVKRLQWGRSTTEKVERDLRRFLQRTVRAAPGAACLVVGPLDAVLGPEASRPFQQREYLDEVIALERTIALEEGCAFFDLFTAMGGTGAIQRFHARGFMHDDLVHPKGHGLDILGALMADALLRSWSGTPRTEQPAALARAWATLVGVDLLPHEEWSWAQAPRVALLPEEPADALMAGIQRVLDATRPWGPRPGTRCVTLVPRRASAEDGNGCLPVTPPPLPADLQDSLHQETVLGAWLLAERVRQDSLAAAWSHP